MRVSRNGPDVSASFSHGRSPVVTHWSRRRFNLWCLYVEGGKTWVFMFMYCVCCEKFSSHAVWDSLVGSGFYCFCELLAYLENFGIKSYNKQKLCRRNFRCFYNVFRQKVLLYRLLASSDFTSRPREKSSLPRSKSCALHLLLLALWKKLMAIFYYFFVAAKSKKVINQAAPAARSLCVSLALSLSRCSRGSFMRQTREKRLLIPRV